MLLLAVMYMYVHVSQHAYCMPIYNMVLTNATLPVCVSLKTLLMLVYTI